MNFFVLEQIGCYPFQDHFARFHHRMNFTVLIDMKKTLCTRHRAQSRLESPRTSICLKNMKRFDAALLAIAAAGAAQRPAAELPLTPLVNPFPGPPPNPAVTSAPYAIPPVQAGFLVVSVDPLNPANEQAK